MYDERSTSLDKTVFCLDIVFTIIMFFLALWSKFYWWPEDSINIYSHISLIPLILVFLLSFLTYFGGYSQPGKSSHFFIAWAVSRALALSIGVLMTLLFFLEIQYVSRLLILIFAGLEFVNLLGIRFAVKRYYHSSISSGKHSLQVLIIGTGKRAKELSRKLKENAEWGLEVVGHLDPDASIVGSFVDGVKVIGTVADITRCFKEHVIDEVIIAIPRNFLEDAEPIAQACEEEGVKLRFMADLFNLHVVRISLTYLGKIPLLTMEPVAHDDDKLLVKRIFDFVLILLSMPFFLPVMVVVALAIKLDSPGPALFVQQRVGLRKHLFPMMKFRSMCVDAEARLKDIEHLNEAEGPIFKMTNDPRLTRVGRFIRKTSLDELPQLFNVLRGEMSLVGPRPMSIRDVDLFDKGVQRKRFSVKPGITCIWQISGRSNLPFNKWLELDLQYIDNWSLRLDFKILFKTIPVVLKSKGAV